MVAAMIAGRPADGASPGAMGHGMRIEIRLANGRASAMHVKLARRLRDERHSVRMAASAVAAPPIPGLGALMLFEDTVYGKLSQDLFARQDVGGPGFDGAADLTIDLDAGGASGPTPLLTVRYDGGAGEVAALAALLDNRTPEIAIVACATDGLESRVAHGLPALPFPFRIKDSLNRLRARQIDLIVKAVRLWPATGTRTQTALSRPFAASKPLLFGASVIAHKVASRLQRLASGGARSKWRVAWRAIKDDAVRQTFAWPGAAYNVLPDDGGRFFADPFIYVHRGASWLFVEEFPYATNTGIISVCEISRDGVAGPPKPVLEIGSHLSYPFIFERDGVIYMMPESAGARRVDLYRAERFPDVWVHDRTLIDNIAVADATMIERNGRLWLLASPADDGQSDWDTLSVFHAGSLNEKWTALNDNPVMFDASQARSAGYIFERGGQLYRPVQDCTRGYGSALALCRIDRLEEDGYVQSPAVRLAPPDGGGVIGLHSLNEAAGIEVIDFFGPAMAKLVPLNQKAQS